MRQALQQGLFEVYYQPQVALGDGRLVGAEALARWSDPQFGDVPTSVFIPLAEETGVIIALGNRVLEQAVRQAAAWHRAGAPLRVAVNVSALQFQQADFAALVDTVLQASGLPPPLLELELTESILVRDADEALERLRALARIGVAMSIDDFGTGYSSLAYLKRFPISRLKIDDSFVAGLPQDDSDKAIVSAIVGMARAIGFDVVAEGVETQAQRDCLRDLGCTAYQGYLCSPALPLDAFERFVAALPAAPR